MAFVQIRDLRRTYRAKEGDRVKEQVVFDGLSLDIEEGEFVAVVGPSGCGKSTLLNLIGGLDALDRRVPADAASRGKNGREEGILLVEGGGSIRIKDFPISEASGDAKADFINQNIGFVFQSHHLIAELSILDNVALPMMIGGKSRSKSRETAEATLEKVSMGGAAHKRPAVLSGGEKQRVAIARALVNSPCLLLADEPTGSLDPKLKDSVFEVFLKLNRDERLTVVLVTHDHGLIHDASGRPKVDRILDLGNSRPDAKIRGAALAEDAAGKEPT